MGQGSITSWDSLWHESDPSLDDNKNIPATNFNKKIMYNKTNHLI